MNYTGVICVMYILVCLCVWCSAVHVCCRGLTCGAYVCACMLSCVFVCAYVHVSACIRTCFCVQCLLVFKEAREMVVPPKSQKSMCVIYFSVPSLLAHLHLFDAASNIVWISSV